MNLENLNPKEEAVQMASRYDTIRDAQLCASRLSGVYMLHKTLKAHFEEVVKELENLK